MPALSPELEQLRRVNLGCGFDKRDGYLNVDLQPHHEPDLLADARDLSGLPEGHYSEILAIDVLEHLPRSDTDAALTEWLRLLEPDGELVLRIPDLLACARRLLSGDSIADHELWIHNLWGTQAYTGDFHLAAFTDLLIVDALTRSGYDAIQLSATDGWMLTARARRPLTGQPRRAVAVGWLGGVYDREADGEHWWRWSDGDCDILLVNTDDAPVDVSFRIGLVDILSRAGSVRATIGDVVADVPLGPEAGFVWGTKLGPAPLRTRLTSDRPTITVEGDSRRLSLQLMRPEIAVSGATPTQFH